MENMNEEEGELLLEYAELGNLHEFQKIVVVIFIKLYETDEDIKIDTILNYKEWELGETALMVSTRENHLSIVNFLLEYGANPNIKNNEGDTALMYAVSIPNNLDDIPRFRNIRMWGIAHLLLKHGANPLIKNNEGKTAYDIVVDEGIINRVKDNELLQELKKYMRIYRIQALRRGNLTRRKLKTSMARRRSALSRLGDTYGLDEDVIQMLNSRISRPSHIDMIEETPYNM